MNLFRRIPWQDVCKFLAGAFFVNSGVLFYLYLARVSVSLLGTSITQTPEVSGVRSIVHAVLFLVFFYLGFIRGKAETATANKGLQQTGCARC